MLMCESTRYGHLCTQDGSSLPTEIAARGCGLEVAHYELGLAELSEVGLIRRDVNGVIFDPDMVEFARRWSRLIYNSDDLDSRRDGDRKRKRRTSAHVNGVSLFSKSLESSSKDFTLPEWIPTETWEAFVEMRNKIRAPMTRFASKCIVADLERIKEAGGNPVAALEQSISRSWRGVFDPQGGKCTQLGVLSNSIGKGPEKNGIRPNPAAIERMRKREEERLARERSCGSCGPSTTGAVISQE